MGVLDGLGELLDEEGAKEAEAAEYLQEAPEEVEQENGSGTQQRNRRWEAENRATPYRIDGEINERIKGIKADLLEDGFRTTTSAIAEALLWRGLDAWDAGEELEIWGQMARTYSRNSEGG